MPEKIDSEPKAFIFWAFQTVIVALGTIGCTFLWWIFGELHSTSIRMASLSENVAFNTSRVVDHEARIRVIESRRNGRVNTAGLVQSVGGI